MAKYLPKWGNCVLQIHKRPKEMKSSSGILTGTEASTGRNVFKGTLVKAGPLVDLEEFPEGGVFVYDSAIASPIFGEDGIETDLIFIDQQGLIAQEVEVNVR